MKLRKILCFLLCLSLALFLSGCGDTQENTPTTANEGTPANETTTEDPYQGMSAIEKLVAVGTWESEGNPYELMFFAADGTGYIVRSGIIFSHTWTLENNILETDTQINQEKNQITTYEFRMEESNFVITNPQYNTSAKFMIYGTQPKELPEEGEKDTKLIGTWVPDNDVLSGYIFSDDEGVSGRYSTADANREINAEFKWTVYDYTLYMYFVNGPQYKFEYIVSGNTLTLYRDDVPNITYRRAD